METEKRLRKKCFSNLQIEDSTCLFANNCAELARNQLISDIQFCVLRKVKLSAMKSAMASLNHAPREPMMPTYCCLLLLGLLASGFQDSRYPFSRLAKDMSL